MSQLDPIIFGAGTLTLTPPGDNPTPTQVGVLQDISVDITSSTKELHGSDQFPVAIAAGKGKITGKAKSGSINGGVANAILSGGIVTAGRELGADEQSVVSGGAVSVLNAATFTEDLGVLDLTSGLALLRVESAPGPGQYAVADGAYTFDGSADDHEVSIRYKYSVTTGSTIVYSNQPMGRRTVFVVNLFNEFEGDAIGIKLHAAVFTKLTFPFKNEDFAMNDLDFECFQDAQRRVISISTPNVIPPTE